MLLLQTMKLGFLSIRLLLHSFVLFFQFQCILAMDFLQEDLAHCSKHIRFLEVCPISPFVSHYLSLCHFSYYWLIPLAFHRSFSPILPIRLISFLTLLGFHSSFPISEPILHSFHIFLPDSSCFLGLFDLAIQYHQFSRLIFQLLHIVLRSPV